LHQLVASSRFPGMGQRLTPERLAEVRADHADCTNSCDARALLDELDAVTAERDELDAKLHRATAAYLASTDDIKRERGTGRSRSATRPARRSQPA
jgi:hypothetical protein